MATAVLAAGSDGDMRPPLWPGRKSRAKRLVTGYRPFAALGDAHEHVCESGPPEWEFQPDRLRCSRIEISRSRCSPRFVVASRLKRAARVPRRREERQSMAGERPILIVDDDATLRETLVEQLEVEGEFSAAEA